VAETKTRAGDLVLHVTDQGDGAVFDIFFAGYDQAFVLPDEKEGADGFRACLALNHGAEHERLTARYGPFREICIVAEDPATGAPAGGANFIAMPIADRQGRRRITANLNYIYVDATMRGKGYLGRLMRSIEALVSTLFETAESEVLIFIEQNDPFAMSAQSYERDTRYTGLDQIDRLRIWARRGAKVVDFPYAQPPLSADQEADHGLLYSVLGARAQTLDSCVLAGHLERFFGISVLKGAPIETQPGAAAQIDSLRQRCQAGTDVALLDPGPLLSSLSGVSSSISTLGAAPADFREALSLWALRANSA
jgi:GNAT superfamily N-acetyltransferase